MISTKPPFVSQYRKRPLLVEAVQLIDQDHEDENMVAVADWISDNGWHCDQGPHHIVAHQGRIGFVARHGDYIFRGPSGTFYRASAEDFEAVHRSAENEPESMKSEARSLMLAGYKAQSEDA